ncbi:hypothetical protein GCM10010493_37440 [Streptomyces lavendulae subsp. grasserius]
MEPTPSVDLLLGLKLLGDVREVVRGTELAGTELVQVDRVEGYEGAHVNSIVICDYPLIPAARSL